MHAYRVQKNCATTKNCSRIIRHCSNLLHGLPDTLLYVSCSQYKKPPHDSSLAREDATISSQCYISCTGFQFDVEFKVASTSRYPDKHLSTWLTTVGSCLRPVDVLCGQPMSWHVRCREHKTVTVTGDLPSSACACGTTCHHLCEVIVIRALRAGRSMTVRYVAL